MSRAAVVALSLLVFAVLTAGLLALARLDVDWSGWRPAPDAHYVEASRPGAVRQPVNTASSLANVLVGVGAIVTSLARRRPGAPMVASRLYGVWFGALVVGLGLCSALYHASLAFAWQWLDALALFGLAVFVTLHGLVRAGRLGPRGFVAGFAALGLLGLLPLAWPAARRPLFGALVLVAVAVEGAAVARAPGRQTWFWLALAALLGAFACWGLDGHVAVEPSGWLQLHAGWHVFGAVSLGCLFVHLRRGADGGAF
ncbi:MAG: ceramidase domain-containing protein [Planctomycetes bacterium]|nr:ceramidase domain-containing protein [Planctomycetota bacterium]